MNADDQHPLGREPAEHRPNAAVMLRHGDGVSVDQILAQAVAADRQGYHSVWLGDHLINPFGGDDRPDGPFDSFTLVPAIAALTEQVRFGWAMLNPSFRNPALLAKMLATLDQVSHGRVICTLGAGWFAREYEAYDLTFHEDPAERAAYLREVVEMIKELWTRPAPERVTFDGRFVKARELPFNPAPVQQPHPPIWIGGDSERTLALVRDLADGWVIGAAPAPYERLAAVRAGDWPERPIAVAKISHVAVASSEKELAAESRRIYDGLRPTFGPALGSYEEFVASEIVGLPEECHRRLAEALKRGLDTHIFYFIDDEHQARVAKLLLPL